MKKLILLLILCTSCVTEHSLYGQSEIDSTDSAYFAAMESYFRTLMEEDSSATKKYLRYEAKIKKKLDQNNSLIPYQRAIRSVCNNACPGQDLANWQLESDYVYEVGNVQWNGFVSRVSPDPREINNSEPARNALLGLPSGGLFKFDIATSKWIPKTDGLNEYGLGITEILRDANSPDDILISTGIGHTGDYGTSAGLYSSPDNGDTWLPWSTMFPGFDPCKTHIIGLYYNYDNLGNPGSILPNFFLIERQHGTHDRLWEWCGITWIDHTPQEYIDRVTGASSPYDPNLQLVDFTATSNSLVLTTNSPYNNAGAAIFHAPKSGSCSFPLTWTDNTGSLPAFSVGNNQNLAVSDYNGSVIFARSKGNNNNTLYSSTDGGLTWLVETNSIIGGTKLDMEYSPQTGLVYLGETYMKVWDYVGKVLHSANSSSQHADIRDMKVIGLDAIGNELLAVANDGGVSITTYDPTSSSINSPGAVTHRPVSGTSMPIQQVWGLGITQSVNVEIAKGDMHNNSFAYTGGSWCKFGYGDGGNIQINHTDNSTVYFSTNPNVKKGNLNSICGSWGTQIFNTSQWQFGRPLELNSDNQCKLYFGDDYNCHSWNPSRPCDPNYARLIIYDDCSTPPNSTIIPLNINVTGNNPGQYMNEIGAIGIAESNSKVIYLGSHGSKAPGQSGVFLKSIDGGLNWIDLSNSNVTYNSNTNSLTNSIGWLSIEDIVVSPYDENIVILSISGTRTGLRVLWSFDGGFNFFDYSPGLTDLPVNTLEYFKNSNDLLFAGTDAGVYYRDNTMSQWVCFTENLGLTWTTDLDINYCNNELYATTYGRGVYKTSLNALTPVRRFHRISSNTTWNYNKVIYSDVIIEPGVTLDITGAKIQFAEGKRIIVNPTAQLNVINSEMTTLCDDSCWDGITIEGNSNAPQTTAFQGKAFISGSTLSNARNAINILGVNETTPNLATDWSQMGGIIEAVNSEFINNRRAAQFLSYENIVGGIEIDNVSTFTDCNFWIDTANCGSNSPFITMFGVNGVRIKGCTFEDKRSGISMADYRDGISTSESTFSVHSNGNDKCIFKNLKQGINATAVNASNNLELEIIDAEFYNNETAIRLYDVNNESIVTNNKIIIGHPASSSSYGIVPHNSSGFQISENYCKKDPGYSGWTHGFDIYNTINTNNPDASPVFGHNVVYNNISEGNNAGFKAWGDNVAANGDGLEFLCNQNIGNTNVDFWIFDCIQMTQGSITQPAGNIFSCNGTPPFDVAPVAQNCITYHHDSSDFICPYTGVNIQLTNASAACNYYENNTDYCLFFDGGDDRVEAPATSLNSIGTQDFTFEARIQGNTFNQNTHPVIFSNRNGASPGVIFGLHNQWNGCTPTTFKMLMVQLNGVNYFICDNGTYNASLLDGVCHHVAVSRQGSLLSFYIDGQLIGTKTIAGTPSVASGNTLIIGDDNVSSNPFLGSISDIRIWNVARTAIQIQDNASLFLSGSETNLIANWKMDEGTGQTVCDSSPNNFHGALGTNTSSETMDPTWNSNCCSVTWQACDEIIDLGVIALPNGLTNANRLIISSGTVTSGSNVSLEAGQTIQFGSGFSIEPGGILNTSIQDCYPCWDTNQSGSCESQEDTNNDGVCDGNDC